LSVAFPFESVHSQVSLVEKCASVQFHTYLYVADELQQTEARSPAGFPDTFGIYSLAPPIVWNLDYRILNHGEGDTT
jgi:hypothetical protein